MKFTVDRFEENLVVIELPDKTIINIPKSFFKEDLIEGRSYSFSLELLPENESVKEKFNSLFE